MAEWTIVHLDHDEVEIDTFHPENLQFNLEKGENGPHTINYEISRSADNVAPLFVRPYVTDFELYRDTDLILAGMHTMFSVNSDEEHCKIGGKGWLHYLERRFWPFDPNDPDAHKVKHTGSPTPDDPGEGFAYKEFDLDPMQIIADILDEVLAEPESLAITYSLTNIGETVDIYTIDLIDTENILSKIQSLAQRDPGDFDFWITNAKQFQRANPRIYDLAIVDDDTEAEHIFEASDLDTGLNNVRFTNTGPEQTRLYGQGVSQAIERVSRREYIPGSEQFRLLEGHTSFGDVSDSTSVSRLTRKKMLFGLNPVHEITIEVVTEQISNFWTRFKPGIGIWLYADLEGWDIQSAQEVVTMNCSIDNEGNELVTLKLNQIYGAETLS
jgi:hypothetical protein